MANYEWEVLSGQMSNRQIALMAANLFYTGPAGASADDVVRRAKIYLEFLEESE